jgi:archaeosine-15-forming tRNA-guanine transglycosylase
MDDNYIVVPTQPTLNLFNRRTMKMERKITVNGSHYTTFRIRDNLLMYAKIGAIYVHEANTGKQVNNFMHSQLKPM